MNGLLSQINHKFKLGKHMGQFLAIGLATQVGVKKKDADMAGLNLGQLQEKMQQGLHFVPEIYVAGEHDGFYLFKIKDEVFHAQLVPFLQTIYPLLYTETQSYDDVIQRLQTIPPSEWIKLAEEKPKEAFQLNDFSIYGSSDYIEVGYSNIHVYFECILLSMEGKISMETYGRQFNFFKYTMMQTFKQFSLSGALRVFITE